MERILEWVEEGIRGFRPRLAMPWEDVQQELLLEVTALLRRNAFRGESSLRTYLWRVAKYRCLNLLRDQAKPAWSDGDEDELVKLPAPGSSPLESLLEGEKVDLLVRLTAELPAECRQIWTMVLAGMSYADMSRELAVAPGALRVRALRCRRRATTLWERWRGRPPEDDNLGTTVTVQQRAPVLAGSGEGK